MSIQPVGTIETSTPADAIYRAQAVLQAQPANQSLAAQQAAQDLNGVSYLTAGDRDLLTYLYGTDFVQNLSLGVLPLQTTQTQAAQTLQNAQDLAAAEAAQNQAAQVQAAQVQATRNEAAQNTQDLQAVQSLLTPQTQPAGAVPSTAAQIQAAAQTASTVPQFVLDLIDDRRSGVLPIGTEITSSYVQNQYDAYLAATGSTPVPSPLTDDELRSAQDYFDRRVTGAAVDLQA